MPTNLKIGLSIGDSQYSNGGSPPVVGDYLLLESGDALLLEDGSYLLLE